MEEIIIKEREFKEKLVKLINESGLPAFAIKPTLKEMFEQVNILEQQQYKQACNERDKKEEKKSKAK